MDQVTVEGRTPSGSKDTFSISPITLEEIRKAGRSAQYDDLRSVEPAMKSPHRIYRGLRAGYEDAFCYVGRPPYFAGDVESAAPDGFVFTVFIKDWVIFEWGWEKADPSDPDAPVNATTRFDELLWKH